MRFAHIPWYNPDIYWDEEITMSKTSKTEGSVFEIRPGVYAYGAPGQKAAAVVQRDKGGGAWVGVRGVKPTIGMGAKQGNPPSAAAAKLATLGG